MLNKIVTDYIERAKENVNKPAVELIGEASAASIQFVLGLGWSLIVLAGYIVSDVFLFFWVPLIFIPAIVLQLVLTESVMILVIGVTIGIGFLSYFGTHLWARKYLSEKDNPGGNESKVASEEPLAVEQMPKAKPSIIFKIKSAVLAVWRKLRWPFAGEKPKNGILTVSIKVLATKIWPVVFVFGVGIQRIDREYELPEALSSTSDFVNQLIQANLILKFTVFAFDSYVVSWIVAGLIGGLNLINSLV